jgi:hypothetical protein
MPISYAARWMKENHARLFLWRSCRRNVWWCQNRYSRLLEERIFCTGFQQCSLNWKGCCSKATKCTRAGTSITRKAVKKFTTAYFQKCDTGLCLEVFWKVPYKSDFLEQTLDFKCNIHLREAHVCNICVFVSEQLHCDTTKFWNCSITDYQNMNSPFLSRRLRVVSAWVCEKIMKLLLFLTFIKPYSGGDFNT